MGEILFDKLGLPPVKKTATGKPSTDEEVLTQLADDYPLPKLLLEHRSLAKLKSTYADKLPRMVNPRTGRVHTSFSQAVAVTGRLASSEPNLQNIPIRTEEGRRIRAAFIAPKGHVIVSAVPVAQLVAYKRESDEAVSAHQRERVTQLFERLRLLRQQTSLGGDIKGIAREGLD